jgi:hypothetical protein
MRTQNTDRSVNGTHSPSEDSAPARSGTSSDSDDIDDVVESTTPHADSMPVEHDPEHVVRYRHKRTVGGILLRTCSKLLSGPFTLYRAILPVPMYDLSDAGPAARAYLRSLGKSSPAILVLTGERTGLRWEGFIFSRHNARKLSTSWSEFSGTSPDDVTLTPVVASGLDRVPTVYRAVFETLRRSIHPDSTAFERLIASGRLARMLRKAGILPIQTPLDAYDMLTRGRADGVPAWDCVSLRDVESRPGAGTVRQSRPAHRGRLTPATAKPVGASRTCCTPGCSAGLSDGRHKYCGQHRLTSDRSSPGKVTKPELMFHSGGRHADGPSGDATAGKGKRLDGYGTRWTYRGTWPSGQRKKIAVRR